MELSHLPMRKQEDLADIVKIIQEIASPEKIILFGSHASDKWIEDEYEEEGATYSYISDYDILVVLSPHDKGKEHEIASKIENRTLNYMNDVSPIVHSIDYVNKGLENGQYFFRDIVREGLVLFDTGRFVFSESMPLSKNQEKRRALQNYENWIEIGSAFLEGTLLLLNIALNKGKDLRQVIFNLNQSAEKFYGGILLIYTGYKPKTHRLKIYRKYSKNISDELNEIFKVPFADEEEYRLFEVLNKSYLDSRYQDGYSVEIEDLLKLVEKVKKLEEISIKLCKSRISLL